MQEIPRPLLDRMEVIEISGYTENEKEHIAKEHLVPKQLDVNGIPKGRLTIQAGALRKIINLYTKEAGVRDLERKIGQICRKAAREIMEDDQKKITVSGKNLEKYLGKPRYSYLMANKKDEEQRKQQEYRELLKLKQGLIDESEMIPETGYEGKVELHGFKKI